MFLRCIVLAACLASASGSAEAQGRYRVYGPEGIALTIGPLGPNPTVEGVTALLNEALSNYDNNGIQIREGVVRRDEEFATRVVPYERVARLQNDVSRAGALGGRVVLLPAGSVVYSHEFINSDMLAINGSTRVLSLWCGANGSRGACLLRRGGAWEAAEINSDTPFAPTALGSFVPANEPELTGDPAALAELPPRTEVYRFAGARGSRARIARSLRVGDDTIPVADILVSGMRLGSLMVRIESGPEPQTAIIHVTALDPADHRTELRRIALGLADPN